jgi:aspartate racemase
LDFFWFLLFGSCDFFFAICLLLLSFLLILSSMRTIGLIGGLSWLSTIDYYRAINEQINQRLGGVHAGRIILYSLNFGEIKELTMRDDWPAMTRLVADAAKKLQQSGADCILIGANTMHKIAPQVQEAIQVPLIHIAEVTAAVVREQPIKKVALLGTKYTMQLDFYPDALRQYGIETIIPAEKDRDYIHATIYNELGKGIFTEEIRNRYKEIINRLVQQGAEGVILGCTEIPLLIKQKDSPVPVFDTALIHATAAVDFALETVSPG